ncbi:MAG: SipW-dependent-type signal peptide-containing protein [Halolamina sp.]
MPNDTFGLSRRKLLGAAGTIGGAAAIGGSSTLAFFSDEERFPNNQLTAGELDLKLAWQELYFGASAEDAFESGSISTANLFANQALTESYPAPGAGVTFETLASDDACAESSFYADTPEDLDPTAASSHRSLNDDTYNTQANQPKPILSITDAKPADFGFLRFRLVLCDNPGYIWVSGTLETEAENGLNEPESKDSDQPTGAQAGGGELADELRVRLVQATSGAAIENLFGGLSATTGPELSEQVIDLFDLESAATLREFVNATSQNVGLPLDAEPFSGGASGSALTPDVFMYDISDGGAQQGDRVCFEPNASAGQLGLVTALPADHANEIQSDSLSVDLTFYTEQCRHNDGSGMN